MTRHVGSACLTSSPLFLFDTRGRWRGAAPLFERCVAVASKGANPKAKLNPRQRQFVAEYLKDKNATQAAIRAGYAAKDADVQGPRLLGHVGIAALISEGLERQEQRAVIKADEILNELRRIATCDIGQAIQPDGKVKPLHEMPEDVRRAISSIEVEAWNGPGIEERDEETGEIVRKPLGYTTKLKFWNKNDAIRDAMKHLGIAGKEKVEVEGKLTLEQLLNAVHAEEK